MMAVGERPGARNARVALALVALYLVVALTTAASASPAGPRARVQAVFTTETPGASSGRTENGDFFDPDVPGGKPHSVRRVGLELARGGPLHTTAIPQRSATHRHFMLGGATASPRHQPTPEGAAIFAYRP